MNLLTTKIQKDWDDRIKLNSRFWMGDDFHSNESMWETGKRDLELILENYDPQVIKSWNTLEYGCGVGRILQAASVYFNSVTGVDSSAVAIDLAKETLKNFNNLDFFHTSGNNLKDFDDKKYDFCYSFACLNHIPLKILSHVLLEITRILKDNSNAVLQLYVGSHPTVVDRDTITIRGYPEACIKNAFIKLGYKVLSMKPLILPFDAYDYERNLTPFLINLEKIEETRISAIELENYLNPIGEQFADENWEGSHFEYRLAATLLNKHSEDGNIEEAIKTLEFAMEKYKKNYLKCSKLLAKLTELRDS